MRHLAILATVLTLTFVPSQAQEAPATRLHALFGDGWQRWLREHPDMASIFGLAGFNDAWPDVSLAALEDNVRYRKSALEKLKAIDPDKLTPSDRLHYALFRREYETEIAGHALGWHLTPLSHMEGIQDISSLLDSLTFTKAKDYDDWLTRLQRYPQYMDQYIALLEEGMRHGRVQPRVAMKRVPAQVQRQLVDDPEQCTFYRPFRRFPPNLSLEERTRLEKQGRDAVARHVLPSLRKLLTFLDERYLPACYEGVGVGREKKGRELYAFLVRHHTSTGLSPEEIHAIGLQEVRRIRAEMNEVLKQVGFKGTFREFVAELRQNPRFYYKTGQELMAATKEVCDRVEAQLPRMFGKLPRTKFLLEPVPGHIAPDAPMGYYLWPSADGRRPGIYYVNLYRPEVRPKYQIEALSLHEAVPGHHLQISLAFEQEKLPAFRRFTTGYTAFVEGWALYSESLGEQLGMYQDPYSKFGQLDFAIWRAVRLVVDTGMHAKKWTRDEAIKFAEENSAFSRHSIETEIDRYACWPGQALAYKIGELKIKELRARAEKSLGKRFDIRPFHDVVLANGAVPLDVLEGLVTDWIEQTKGNAKSR